MSSMIETLPLGDLVEGIKLKIQPSSPVTKIYHYTTPRGLEKIEKAGFLFPLTSPLRRGPSNKSINAYVESNPDFFGRKHIVAGVNSPSFQKWKDFDIHDRLVEYIARMSTYINSSYLYLLSFPVEVVPDAYILDHAHDSPKRFQELYGSPNNVTLQRYEYLTQLERYYRSAVKLSDYSGKYKVPEIWIPHPVRYEDITIVREARVADFKLPFNIFD